MGLSVGWSYPQRRAINQLDALATFRQKLYRSCAELVQRDSDAGLFKKGLTPGSSLPTRGIPVAEEGFFGRRIRQVPEYCVMLPFRHTFQPPPH